MYVSLISSIYCFSKDVQSSQTFHHSVALFLILITPHSLNFPIFKALNFFSILLLFLTSFAEFSAILQFLCNFYAYELALSCKKFFLTALLFWGTTCRLPGHMTYSASQCCSLHFYLNADLNIYFHIVFFSSRNN